MPNLLTLLTEVMGPPAGQQEMMGASGYRVSPIQAGRFPCCCCWQYCTVRVRVSNGPSGGQIMLIVVLLALWRMYR